MIHLKGERVFHFEKLYVQGVIFYRGRNFIEGEVLSACIKIILQVLYAVVRCFPFLRIHY